MLITCGFIYSTERKLEPTAYTLLTPAMSCHDQDRQNSCPCNAHILWRHPITPDL